MPAPPPNQTAEDNAGKVRDQIRKIEAEAPDNAAAYQHTVKHRGELRPKELAELREETLDAIGAKKAEAMVAQAAPPLPRARFHSHCSVIPPRCSAGSVIFSATEQCWHLQDGRGMHRQLLESCHHSSLGWPNRQARNPLSRIGLS